MVDKMVAFITCKCGAEFQVLGADGEWDESATLAQYQAHECPEKPTLMARLLGWFVRKK